MHIVSGRVKSFFAEALRHWRWNDGVNLRKFGFRVLLGRVLSGQPCQCSPRICDIWICIIQSCTRAVDAFECVAIETEACRCKSIDPTETKRWRSPWWKIAFVVFVPSSCALTNFCLLNQYFSSLILVHINVQFDILLGMFAGALAAQVGRLKLRDDDVTAFAGSMCTPSSEPNTITWGFVNNIRTEAASIHMWWSVERVL